MNRFKEFLFVTMLTIIIAPASQVLAMDEQEESKETEEQFRATSEALMASGEALKELQVQIEAVYNTYIERESAVRVELETFADSMKAAWAQREAAWVQREAAIEALHMSLYGISKQNLRLANALKVAVKSDDPEAVQAVLDGALQNSKKSDISLFINEARYSSSSSEIQNSDADDDDIYGDIQDSNKTSLMMACEQNNSEIVTKLINAGAHTNVFSLDSRNELQTPLAHAITKKNAKVVKILLENNADVNLYLNFEGQNPLIIAVNQKDAEIVRLLLERKPWLYKRTTPVNDPMIRSIKYYCPNITIMLAAAGVDLTERYSDGTSLLMDKITLEMKSLILAAAQIPAYMELGEQVAQSSSSALTEHLPVNEVRSLIGEYLMPAYQQPLLNEFVVRQSEQRKKDNKVLSEAEQAVEHALPVKIVAQLVWDYAPGERNRVRYAQVAQVAAAQALLNREWATNVVAGEQAVKNFLPEDRVQRLMWSYIPEEHIEVQQIRATRVAADIEEEDVQGEVACYNCGQLNKVNNTYCRSCNTLLPNDDGFFD